MTHGTAWRRCRPNRLADRSVGMRGRKPYGSYSWIGRRESVANARRQGSSGLKKARLSPKNTMRPRGQPRRHAAEQVTDDDIDPAIVGADALFDHRRLRRAAGDIDDVGRHA